VSGPDPAAAASPEDDLAAGARADWQRRVAGRSSHTAAARAVDRGTSLIRAAATVLDRADGGEITVQEVADEAGQSLRTLYQFFDGKDDLLLAVFEEAMRTYARLVRSAIADLADPLERLAGAMVAAARMPEVGRSGLDRGLARLRLRLAEVRPDLVGRAHAAVASLVRELIDEAAAAGRVEVADPEAASYIVLSLNGAYITAETLGNDVGATRPDVEAITSFCLRGLRAELDDGWFDAVNARLRLPQRR
jgi:AcrR family transcriptional regulator